MIKASERVGVHSHIRGLGIRNNEPQPVADGLVGQIEARRAAWLVVQLIKKGKMAGRAILFVGPPGTGKTALAVAIARELGPETPLMALTGSEIYSAELKKTEVLMQAMRKSIGVRIRERRWVYEGVVEKIEYKFDRHPLNPYQQIPVGGIITLKTDKETRTLKVDSNIVYQLLQRGVSEGDVIWIDEETGRVTRAGRVKGYGEYDVGASELVDMPKGPIYKEKEFVYTLTLHDLDEMQSRSESIISLFFGAPEYKEIPPDVRAKVDKTVKEWVENGRAELIPGVLFIDDAHMLDIEAFSFLSRAMESELSPIIILATNRGYTRIRGTDIESPHGMPLDLLDRLLIIKTQPYTPDEIREILKIRAKEEGVELEDTALEELVKLGSERSLRYASQLLAPSKILAEQKGKTTVTVEEVQQASKLFISTKESAKYLQELEEKMLK
ncbi:MAG: RuvB-like helicase [Thermofilum sp.]|uniref:DNA helicase n=1 Tax=Thermofilum adornatum 1505 TaxID=697581 RepID=A0A3G1A5N4_9CREN|nr:RuvB-like helicase [Thermofilum adornatum]AJB41318.1 TBP-interacting protein TIP49 [Thermofilum adornatum 1505]